MWYSSKFGLLQNETSTVTIANFTAEKFKEFNVIVPPINLQTQFAKIAEQIEVAKAGMEASLREMDRHFEGLIGRMFK